MNLFENGLLKYLSTKQLEKIQAVKIGIGGAGGIGSNVAVTLARCGFKHLEIIDHDDIEPSNLNRQQYFIKDIGKPKLEILKARLLQINPDANVKIHKTKWLPRDGKKYFQGCSFIVEGFDRAEDKRNFIEYYQDKAEYIVSANGLGGFSGNALVKIRKLKNIYLVGDNSTAANRKNPPMAPRTIACAAIMSGIILEIVKS